MRARIGFAAIVALGFFLRFYRITENLVFNGEIGDNYLAIKNFLANRTIPLLGPPTSHPWLSFGPLFYWLFAPVLIIFKFQPIAGSYFFAAIGVTIVLLNYFVIKKVFGGKVALISSFLIAISPAFLDVARQARFFSLVIPLFYIFYFLFLKILGGSKKYIFWLGFTFGVMLNFHYTPLVLLPVVFYYLFKNRHLYKMRDYLNLLIGFIIPNIPFLIYNFENRFQMLKEFTVWIPYRIAGFTGLYHKNSLNFVTLVSNIKSLISFISLEFLPKLNSPSIVVSFLFFILILYLFFQDKRKSTEILILFLLIGYFALFIHGEPPSHYYFPILPIPIILISILAGKIFTKRFLFVFLCLGILLLMNDFTYYFSGNWFYQKQGFIANETLIPFKIQQDIAKNIVKDAKSQPFSLSRVGQYDYFEGSYAQNYTYLLWLYGNEPKPNTKIRYTIHEESTDVSAPNEVIVDNVVITKDVEK